jgi:hypothetical protein
MHGRQAVRQRIIPLTSTYPNTKMVKYTHDRVYFDARTAEMVFCARTHMADLGDGMDYTATNWTRLKYAGDGLFSLKRTSTTPRTSSPSSNDGKLPRNRPNPKPESVDGRSLVIGV